MRKLVLLFGAIVIVAHSFAQLTLGKAVVTNSASSCSQQVVQIFDVHNPLPANLGNNWGLPTDPVGIDWTMGNLGQVFGIAINSTGTDPLIYVSNTQSYFAGPACPIWQEYPTLYSNGTVLIWQLNGTDGSYSPLVVSTQTHAITSSGTNQMYNLGTGIGNICYDADNNLIFATNMEDGCIYRIDAATGNILSRFDPFTAYIAPTPPLAPDFVKRGDRLWGIAYHNHNLYYALWNEDLGHTSNILTNQVYSIALDPLSDQFPAAFTVGAFDYAEPSPMPIIDNIIPICTEYNNVTNQDDEYSNPISDIEISEDGKTLLLSERTMHDASPKVEGLPYNAQSNSYIYYAHRARILRYDFDISTNSWLPTAPAINYNVGNYEVGGSACYKNTNSDGGVDFGYLRTTNCTSSCEGIVWSTGDALKHTTYPYGINEFVYGITGININGNQNTNSALLSSYVRSASYYQDIFGGTPNAATAVTRKSMPGDVDIFRKACCTVTPVVNISTNSGCAGQKVTLTISGGTWGSITVNGQNDDPDHPYFEIPGGAKTFEFSLPIELIGTNDICVTVYSDNPEEAEDYCSGETCFTLIVTDCGCESIYGNSVIKDDGANTFYNDGTLEATFINWFVDGVQKSQTDGHGSYTPNPPLGPGQHEICMVAAYLIPGEDGHDVCCYDTSCETVTPNVCEEWRNAGSLSYTVDPSDYHKVTFTYANSATSIQPAAVLWTFDDGTVESSVNQLTITHYFNDNPDGSLYHVCVDVIWSNGGQPVDINNLEACCCLDEECIDVNVGPCYAAEFNMSLVDAINHNANVQVVSSFPIGYDNILWSIDGVVSPPVGSSSPFHSYDSPSYGPHTLCADVNYSLFYNGREYNCTQEACMNIDWTIVAAQIGLTRFYPNPANNIVTVEVKAMADDDATIEIIDYTGRHISTNEYHSLKQGINYLYLNFSHYDNGMYSMKVKVANNIQTVKVIRN